jgi:arsenate reductase (thioredoxin)
MDAEKKKVLILCTGNSSRSQMAEGYFKKFKKDWGVYSAGIFPKGINPMAVRAMREDGVDISSQVSESANKYMDRSFDYVITVCDNARETCPVFLNAKEMLHWSFEDPADAEGSSEEVLGVFRKVRDEIKQRILDFIKDK